MNAASPSLAGGAADAGESDARFCALLRRLYTQSPLPQGMIECEAGKVRPVFLNPAAERLFSECFSPSSPGPDQPLSLPPAFQSLWAEQCEQARRAGAPRQFECAWGAPEQHRRWLVTVASVEDASAGRPCFSFVAEEITERRRAEEALRASEERLRRALQAGRAVTWEWDLATGTIRYSENAPDLARGDALTPYTTVEGLMQMVHPDDRSRLRQALDRTLQEGCAFDCEYRVRMLDGAYSWILAKGERIISQDGQPRRVLGLSLDITARKRAEAVLQAFCSLGSRLQTVQTAQDAARAILATADTLWSWDSATLDAYNPETDRIEPVLACDIVEGQRREVPSAHPPGPPSARMRRIMRDGPELILRRPPLTPPADAVMFGDTSRPSASIMCVPLRREGQAVGVLSLQSYTPQAYTGADLWALQALADHCGSALERLRALQALREAQAMLERRVQERTAELQATNAALQQSERRLATLLANLPGMAYRCRLDRDWTMEFVSQGCLALTGYAPEDLVGNRRVAFAALMHPEDRERIWQEVHAALHQRRPFQCSYRLHTAHGQEKWVWEQGSGVFGSDGQVEAVEGFITDVTAQRVAQEKLRQSEELHRSIVEGAREGIWCTDARWRITFVNPRLTEMFGYAAEELLGRSITDFMDAEEVALAPAKMMARELGARTTHEARFRRKDGALLWTLVSGNALRDAQGRFVGTVALLTDITELKSSEQVLQTYMEALRTLSRRLLDVQEAERQALARELHDEVGQSLTTLKLALDRSFETSAAPDRAALEHARAVLRDLVTRVRNLSLDLRPAMLDDLGLVPALLWQFERYTAQTRIQVRFTQANLEGRRFGAVVETAAYRVVQEALTNVARHAGVDEVAVRVSAAEGLLRVQVQDQGRGFDLAATLAAGRSSGLRGMQERAALLGGRLHINSDPGAGTLVLAEFPLPEETC